MGVKVTGVQVDMSGVQSKINQIKTDPALGMFAVSECARIGDQYVPYREGALVGSTGASRPWVLVYDQPYARYQFYGISRSGGALQYSKDRHPKATSHWDREIQNRSAEIARALTAKIASM